MVKKSKRQTEFILHMIFFRDAQWNYFYTFKSPKKIGVHFDLKLQGLLGPANDVYFFYLQTFVITELTTRDFNSPREKWK